jgi:hypothetical protein
MARNRIAVLTLGAALACGLGAGSASAQSGGVNDCTLLTDPTLLRQCVERARQGGNAGASPSSSQDAFSPHRTPGTDNGTAASRASPSPASTKSSGRGKPGKARTESGSEQPRPGKIP